MFNFACFGLIYQILFYVSSSLIVWITDSHAAGRIPAARGEKALIPMRLVRRCRAQPQSDATILAANIIVSIYTEYITAGLVSMWIGSTLPISTFNINIQYCPEL